MTTDEALEKVRAHVQWCREEGETDLRGILSMIKYLRDDIAKENWAKPAEATDASTPNENVSDGGPLTHKFKQDANPPFAAPSG